jgi:hypothetical protein
VTKNIPGALQITAIFPNDTDKIAIKSRPAGIDRVKRRKTGNGWTIG